MGASESLTSTKGSRHSPRHQLQKEAKPVLWSYTYSRQLRADRERVLQLILPRRWHSKQHKHPILGGRRKGTPSHDL